MEFIRNVYAWACQLWVIAFTALISIFTLDQDVVDLQAFGPANQVPQEIPNPMEPEEAEFFLALENPLWAIGNPHIPVSRMSRKG
ncbi:unnamed protein product [Allacma fusca]|uniref:Uncharacterized protein n=1 Tax=Allacma fusca TaxID=39272 RepID=A0A8J2LC80_9HEXA|nr:unnamed protein product [Allacma fusca]